MATIETPEFSIQASSPSCFYVYNRKSKCFSGWIRGKLNEYYDLKNARARSKVEFNQKCGEYFNEAN